MAFSRSECRTSWLVTTFAALVLSLAPAASFAVAFDVPSLFGAPGETVTLRVFLRTMGEAVASYQFEIAFDSRISVVECDGFSLGDGFVRVSEVGQRPLSDGLLLTCVLQLPDSLGTFPVQTRNVITSNRSGMRFETTVIGGIIASVLETPTPTPTPTRPPGPGICGNGVVEGDEECDDRNAVGGDGCAANCTTETTRTLILGPGVCRGGAANDGACSDDDECPRGRCEHRSRASVQAIFVGRSAPINGSIPIAIGSARAQPALSQEGEQVIESGEIPFVVAADVAFDPIPIGPFCVCARLRRSTALGGLRGRGRIDCRPSGIAEVDYTWIADHDTRDIDPNCELGVVEDESGACVDLPARPTFLSAGPSGSAVADLSLSLTVIPDGGSCCRVGIDPGCPDLSIKGEDGLPCTDDDAIALPSVIAATTGTAQASVLSANLLDERLGTGSVAVCRTGNDCPNSDEACFSGERTPCTDEDSDCRCRINCGSAPCIVEATGVPFDCSLLESEPAQPLTGALVVAFPALNQVIGDTVITGRFAGADPSRTPAFSCRGDCDGDSRTTVDDLMVGVQIALGLKPIDDCPLLDDDASGTTTVDELLWAIYEALEGCGRQRGGL